jgi:acyl-CoA thioesterase FadM
MLLARAETNWAFVRFSDHRLMRIPPEVTGAFELVTDRRSFVKGPGAE